MFKKYKFNLNIDFTIHCNGRGKFYLQLFLLIFEFLLGWILAALMVAQM